MGSTFTFNRAKGVLLAWATCAAALAVPALGENGTSQVYNNGATNATGNIIVGNTGTNNTLSISNSTTVNTHRHRRDRRERRRQHQLGHRLADLDLVRLQLPLRRRVGRQ
jgi:hypothetical protein